MWCTKSRCAFTLFYTSTPNMEGTHAIHVLPAQTDVTEKMVEITKKRHVDLAVRAAQLCVSF